MEKILTNRKSGFPKFTYTGGYIYNKYSDFSWNIEFYTSGILTWLTDDITSQFFNLTLIGGGGAGSNIGPGDNGNNYTTSISPLAINNYEVKIGAGTLLNGTSSEFLGYEAVGGLAAPLSDIKLFDNLKCLEGTGLGGWQSEIYRYKGSSGKIILEGIYESTGE